jgi:hypothetical protein
MKALALGVRSGKLQEALQILDQAIAVMQDGNQDDVHLKSRYATLLQIQASRLRRSLVSSYPVMALSQPDARRTARTTNMSQESVDNSMELRYQEETSSLEFGDFSNFDFNDWLSLPFEPSMAPFGPSEGDVELRLDGVDLDLDFIWQLPP